MSSSRELFKELGLKTKREYVNSSSGVILLFKGEEVVYVGKTTNNLYGRIGAYIQQERDFDSFAFVKCEEEQLNELEVEFIITFNPKYNASPLMSDSYSNVNGLKKEWGITKPHVKRIIRNSGMIPVWKDYYDVKEFSHNFLEYFDEK